MTKFISYLIILFFAYSSAECQTDAQSLYNEMSKRLTNITTISLKFSLKEQAGFKGSLMAKKGNKFIIKTGPNTITCNGKAVWHYSEPDNKVVISPFDKENESSSVEKFFFSFFSNYKPEGFQKEVTSKGKNSYILVLTPSPNKQSGELFKKVKLWVNSDNYNINRLQFDDGQNIQTWEIKQISLNPQIQDKVFDFKTPKDAEVIDMR